MLDITAHAMTINLHLGLWMGAKLDKTAGAHLVRDSGGDDDEAVDVRKMLVSKLALKPVKTAKNAIYLHHIDRTLPWKDNGERMLPRKMYETYIDEHAPLEQAYMDEADRFINVYAQERERAAFRLGSMFDLDDYPHPDDIRPRYYCRMVIDGISDAKDFRVGLSGPTIELIRADIQARTEARIFAAQAEVWKRIEGTVTHFAGRMAVQLEEVEEGQKRPPLHQSTIDNLIHLVNSLPMLNIVGDPNVKAMGRKLHNMLTRYNDADSMKKDTALCAAAHNEVQDIMAEMSVFKRSFEATF